MVTKGYGQTGFLKTVVKAMNPQKAGTLTTEEKAVVKTAMNSTNGLQGGYTLPTDYSTAFFESLAEHSVFRRYARIVPMQTRELVGPKMGLASTVTAGVSPFFGGLQFTWGNPSGTIPDAASGTNQFGQLSLVANDLIGTVTVSNQFVDDIGPAGEEMLVRWFGEAAAWYEDYAFLQGKGTAINQPLGVLNAPARLLTTRETASHVTIKDIAGLASSMIPSGWRNAIWMCSPSVLMDIVRLQTLFVNDSATTVPGCCGTLMTRPLFVTDKLPAMGTQGDLIFFDPSIYAIGSRQEVVIDASQDVLFKNNQTVFRVWVRSDGRPEMDKAVMLPDASSMASGYCVLN